MRATRATLAGVVSGIAIADVALIRCGHPTLSTCIRLNPYMRGLVLYLALHLLFDLPVDPLSRLADRIIPQLDAS